MITLNRLRRFIYYNVVMMDEFLKHSYEPIFVDAESDYFEYGI